MKTYNIHFIKGEGEMGAEVVPEEDYYEEHTAESLYLLLSDIVDSKDKNIAFTLKKTIELLKKGHTCVVMIKVGSRPDEVPGTKEHRVFIIPEPKRITVQ